MVAANASGTITIVEIWPYVINLANCKVATFYIVSGNNLSTRDSEAIGTVIAGSKQTFEVTLEVQEGDYIGMFFNTGYMEQVSNSQTYWFRGGDNIPCTNTLFNVATAGGPFSLYGIGAAIEILEASRSGIYTFKTPK